MRTLNDLYKAARAKYPEATFLSLSVNCVFCDTGYARATENEQRWSLWVLEEGESGRHVVSDATLAELEAHLIVGDPGDVEVSS